MSDLHPLDPAFPGVADFVASVVRAASTREPLLSGRAAYLFALSAAEGAPASATLPVEGEDLDASVLHGRQLLAGSEAPRVALIYLAVLADGGKPTIGLRVDARAGSAKVHCFGAPLASSPTGGPVLRGELWALNASALAVLPTGA